jgi:uncharacterized protein YjbJ (UPF0337 family)
MDKNRMEDPEHGFKRTMKEMMGKATDDNRKGTVIPIRKATGKVKGKAEKAADHVRDTACMDDDRDRGT